MRKREVGRKVIVKKSSGKEMGGGGGEVEEREDEDEDEDEKDESEEVCLVGI